MASILNRILFIILPFITRTVFIYVLGKNYLGLSSLFTSILTVLNLTELGFGSALVYSMYKPAAENDKEKLCALLKDYQKIYRIIGIAILGCGLGLLPFLPKLIKGSWPDGINIYVLFVIYLVNTSISYFAFAYKKALLTAYQRSDIITNVASIVTVVEYFTQIIILLVGKNYYLYVCVLPIFTLIDNLVTGFIVSKKFPDIVCKGELAQEDKYAIKTHVKGIALQKICSHSRNSFDSIVISMYLGLESIAVYNNYYYIMNSVHAFMYLIPNAVRASVGNSVMSESLEKNYRDFNTMSMIYMWISAWSTTCLLCLYQPFMILWMGKDMLLPMSTVVLICFYFYELCMSDIISLYKDGAGLWWFGRYKTATEAAANLILNFILGYFYGISGIVLATVLTIFFIGHGYGGYVVFHYYFKEQKFWDYIRLQLQYLIITIAVASLSYYFCSFIRGAGFGALFGKAALCLVLPNLLLWVILKRTKYFLNAEIFMRNILKKFITNEERK